MYPPDQHHDIPKQRLPAFKRPFMVAGLVFLVGLIVFSCSASYVVDPGSERRFREPSPNVLSRVSEFFFDSAHFVGSCLGLDELPAAMTGSMILSLVLPLLILLYQSIANRKIDTMRFKIRHILFVVVCVSVPLILMTNVGLWSTVVIIVAGVVICGLIYRCVKKWDSFSNTKKLAAGVWTAILLLLTIGAAYNLWLIDPVRADRLAARCSTISGIDDVKISLDRTKMLFVTVSATTDSETANQRLRAKVSSEFQGEHVRIDFNLRSSKDDR